MIKTVCQSLILIFCVKVGYAQKNFNVTIKLDSSINPRKVQYQYFDGKSLVFLPDTFGSKRLIVLKGTYYSPLTSLNVSYTDSTKTYYGNDFFITDKPAVINFTFKSNTENRLDYTFIKNATPIFDTVANKTLARLNEFCLMENKAFDRFFQDNKKGFRGNDSLTTVFFKIYKNRLDRIMLFLRKYPGDYFSFWYFHQQVAQPSMNDLKKDTSYLRLQLLYLKSVFPAKYTESIEGKELIKTYEAMLNPLRINKFVPGFNITTLDGKSISLSDLRGKYVLLDFWATWCAPCMAEMPFIKEIRKDNNPDNFVIIGISQDRDKNKLIATIKKEAMNWMHYYDMNGKISRLYGVSIFPTLVLIDKEGKLLYESDPDTEDKDELPKVLVGLK